MDTDSCGNCGISFFEAGQSINGLCNECYEAGADMPDDRDPLEDFADDYIDPDMGAHG